MGVPSQVGGTPLPGPGKGIPPPGPGKGVPPHLDLKRGYKPPHQPDWGTPPPIEVWTDTQSETITFPHPSNTGGLRRESENPESDTRRNEYCLESDVICHI